MNLLADVWQSMIVCGTTDTHPCQFVDLIALTKAVINNLIVLSTILIVVILIYVGFLLLTSGGDPGAFSKARKIATNVIIGYVCVLAAWIVVYTITSVLLKSGQGYSLLGPP